MPEQGTYLLARILGHKVYISTQGTVLLSNSYIAHYVIFIALSVKMNGLFVTLLLQHLTKRQTESWYLLQYML